MKSRSLDLSIFGCLVSVQVDTKSVANLLLDIYGAFKVEKPIDRPVMQYDIRRCSGSTSAFSVYRDKSLVGTSETLGFLLYIFEKDLTIALQEVRSDLYFLHAAVLEWEGKGVIIIAPSGTGKSTTAWALLNNGFRYLSDELAPIGLTEGVVYGYPRALGLKQKPPKYSLPDRLVETENSLHLPVSAFVADAILGPLPISALFILGDHGLANDSIVESASTSSAAQHIYANSLNALSHENIGLEGAVLLATHTPCFFVEAKQDLQQTCESLRSVL
jgi:hypothetical protein